MNNHFFRDKRGQLHTWCKVRHVPLPAAAATAHEDLFHGYFVLGTQAVPMLLVYSRRRPCQGAVTVPRLTMDLDALDATVSFLPSFTFL